jgi:hypothetical protein
MAYKNKTYVAFDADSDIHYYRLMQAWKQNDNTYFDFFYDAHTINDIRSWSTEASIKQGLRERMLNSKVFVLLVGEKTRFQNTYVRWEIEQALKLDLPIIVVYVDGARSMDEKKCPLILRDKLAIHVSFNRAIMQYALEHWPAKHVSRTADGDNGAYYYKDAVYKDLGL